MNKEQQQIIDEAYENFVNWVLSEENQNNKNEIVKIPSSKEIFIKRIKGDNEIIKKMGKIYCDKFSERWGLKIEERELHLGERQLILEKNGYGGLLNSNAKNYKSAKKLLEVIQQTCDDVNIPTKLITVTYNDKTIESYE
jgi:hypothetical protein